jgi:hypothetical protein
VSRAGNFRGVDDEECSVTRPGKFEEFRFLGDKRSQVVYDLDGPGLDHAAIDELMVSEQFAAFGPDTLTEARNRGYHLARAQRAATDA